jgi:hypothetical protein
MTQWLHIFRKDVWRLRWWLAVWIVLLTMKTVSAVVGPPVALRGLAHEMLIGQLDLIASVAAALMLALLIARLVHEEALVGLDWFWLTRPYDWRALLGAKLLLVTVFFVALPLVTRVIVMTASGAGLAEMLLATPAFVASDMRWALGFMVFAVLTPSLAKFSLAMIGTLTALALLLAAAVSVAIWHVAPETPPSLTAPITDASGLIVMQALALLAAAGTIVYGYRTRRFAPTLVLAILGLAVSFVVPMVWPWSFAAVWPSDHQDSRLPKPVTASLDLTAAPRIDETFSIGGDRRRRVVTVPTHIELPPDFRVQSTFTTSRLSFDARHVLESGQSGGLTTGEGQTLAHPLQGMFPGVRVLPFAPNRPIVPVAALLTVTDGDLQRYGPLHGRLRATVFYNLSRSRIIATLPLTEGATFQANRFRVDVLQVERRLGTCGVVVRRWRVSPPLSAAQSRAYEFVIRNSRKGQAIVGDHRSSTEVGGSLSFLPFAVGVGSDGQDGFDVSHVRIDYPARQEGQVVMPMMERDWLDGAELVVLETVHAGWIAKTMTVDDFQIQPAAAVTQAGR